MTTSYVSFNSLKTANAVAFKSSLDNSGNPGNPALYVWTGRTSPWPNESSPPRPVNNVITSNDARTNMNYLLLVDPNLTALVINNITWSQGVVYAQYDATTTDLYSQNFYIINIQNMVYKCLSNNGGTPSTTAPSGTSVNTQITPDGYKWKFMFDLSPTMVNNFLSSSYIPVPVGSQRTQSQLQVEQSATAIYGEDAPPGGHGHDAATELGVSGIIISTTVDLAAIAQLDGSFSHRQMGLILNPELTTGTAATDAQYILNKIVNFTASPDNTDYTKLIGVSAGFQLGTYALYGSAITGPGVPADTYVTGVIDGTTLQLNQAVTSGNNTTFTATTGAMVNTLTGDMLNCINHLVVSSATDEAETIELVIQF